MARGALYVIGGLLPVATSRLRLPGGLVGDLAWWTLLGLFLAPLWNGWRRWWRTLLFASTATALGTAVQRAGPLPGLVVGWGVPGLVAVSTAAVLLHRWYHAKSS